MNWWDVSRPDSLLPLYKDYDSATYKSNEPAVVGASNIKIFADTFDIATYTFYIYVRLADNGADKYPTQTFTSLATLIHKCGPLSVRGTDLVIDASTPTSQTATAVDPVGAPSEVAFVTYAQLRGFTSPIA